MRILTRGQQGEVYKDLVEIITVLAKAYGRSKGLEEPIQDAMLAAYDIADIVGGQEMLDKMEGVR